MPGLIAKGACLYPTTMGGSSAPLPKCSQTWTPLDLGFQNLLENSGSESSMVHTLSAHQTPNLVSFQILPHDIIVSNKSLVLERSKRAPVNVTGPILQKCCYMCWCSIAFMCFESIFWPLSDSKIQTVVARFQGRKMLTMLEKYERCVL